MIRFLSLLVGVFFTLVAQAGACDSKNPEEFNKFFSQFKTNKEFAIARTLYPYRQSVESEDGVNHTIITKKNDTKYPSLSKFARRENLTLVVESIAKDKAVALMSAPDTGYSFRFNYILKGGCWFLKSVHGISM